MPFAKAQSIFKKILPDKYFEWLYNIVCNGWDIYQKVVDNTIYIPSFIYYSVIGNTDETRKIIVVQSTLPYSMVSRVGLMGTYAVARDVVRQGLKGAFVECGVARGGCSALMALVAKDEGDGRSTWLFDSFEGMPKPSPLDGKQKAVRHKSRTASDLAEGYCLGTFEGVEKLLFAKLGLDRSKVLMVKGWFQDTLPKSRDLIGDIAVLRLDGDWYESTKCCLESLYNKVVSGGYVIVDDYHLVGCKQAVDEFIIKGKLGVNITIDADGTNRRGYWRK